MGGDFVHYPGSRTNGRTALLLGIEVATGCRICGSLVLPSAPAGTCSAIAKRGEQH
jgi:hypothetical protein